MKRKKSSSDFSLAWENKVNQSHDYQVSPSMTNKGAKILSRVLKGSLVEIYRLQMVFFYQSQSTLSIQMLPFDRKLFQDNFSLRSSGKFRRKIKSFCAWQLVACLQSSTRFSNYFSSPYPANNSATNSIGHYHKYCDHRSAWTFSNKTQ